MRFVSLMVGLALCFFSQTTKAADNDLTWSFSVNKRLDSAEKRLERLEKALGIVTEPTPAANKVEPKAKAISEKIRYSVCSRGKCSTYECDSIAQVPPGATIISGLPGMTAVAGSQYCPTGPCGADCQCASMARLVGASTSSFTEETTRGGGIFSRWGERRASRSGGLFGRITGSCCGQ